MAAMTWSEAKARIDQIADDLADGKITQAEADRQAGEVVESYDGK